MRNPLVQHRPPPPAVTGVGPCAVCFRQSSQPLTEKCETECLGHAGLRAFQPNQQSAAIPLTIIAPSLPAPYGLPSTAGFPLPD